MRGPGFLRVFIFLLIFVLFIAYFLRFMAAPLSHDEQHYVSAGILVKSQVLYRDVDYLQTPYLPFIYCAGFDMTGVGHYLFKARTLTFLFLVLCSLALFFLLRRLSKDALLAGGGVFLFLVSSVMTRSAGWADNNIPAMAFFVLACLFFAGGIEEEKPLKLFAGGFFLFCATGIKLFYVLFLAPFLVVLFFFRRSPDGQTGARAFFLGALLGFLPLVYFAIMYPRPFLFDNITYHHLTALWLAGRGEGALLVWKASAHFLKRIFLFDPANAVFPALAALALLFRRKPGSNALQYGFFLFGVGLVLAGGLALFVPRPLYIQHVVLILVPFLVLIAAAFCLLDAPQKKVMRIAVLVFCLLSWLSNGMNVLSSFSAWRPQGWVPVRVAEIAVTLNREAGGLSGKVATLAPLFALESGAKIYGQFSTGPFVYRLGKLVPPLGPVAPPVVVEELFRHDPPSLVLVGWEKDLDRPLEEYALAHGYVLLPGDRMGGRAYRRVR